MHVLQYKNIYVQCFPCEMQITRALSLQVTDDDYSAVWAMCAEMHMEEVILTFLGGREGGCGTATQCGSWPPHS